MRKSGERFDALIYESPLIDAQGRQTGWMGSVLDITERKRAEELYRVQQDKLQFTSRLVAMGEMASTLAHELNQPLSAIASYNTGCMNRLEAGSYARDELIQVTHKIGRQAQRAGEIIRRIYDFVRRTEPRREPCNVNEPLADALALLEADARRRGVRVETRLAATLPPVMADRVMIEQVIFNLARNGIEAMRETPAPSACSASPARPPGTTSRCGSPTAAPGSTPRSPSKLFVPFFTTKDEGMGMGLNICRSITELHKGRLWFEANPAGGTIFNLTLPLVQFMTAPVAHIVDDDEAIRDALSWLFESRGVKAAAWPGAEAFLADYRDDMEGCLVLDIRMPGMSGPELFDALTARRLTLPVIFLTGHGDVPMAVAAIKKGAYDFIEKPFNDNDLVNRVIEALAIDASRRKLQASRASLSSRLETLTPREREVMQLILAGKLNKQVADELDIAMRTVEVHRARVFEKMGVRSARGARRAARRRAGLEVRVACRRAGPPFGFRARVRRSRAGYADGPRWSVRVAASAAAIFGLA